MAAILSRRDESNHQTSRDPDEWKRYVNALSPSQNAHHFANDILKRIFLDYNTNILI